MKNSSKTKLVVLLLTMGLLASCNPSTPTSDSGKTTDTSVNPSETTSEGTSTTSETTSEGTSDTSVETTSEETTSEETTSEETTSEETTSEETTSEETTSEETTSETTSEAGVTLAEVVGQLLLKAPAKRGKLLVDGFVEWEYLGPTIAMNTYLGNYAQYGANLYFETEQGGFVYTRAAGETEFVFDEFMEGEGHGVYDYMIYSPFDFVDEDLAVFITETSETDDAFVVSFDLGATNPYVTFYLKVFANLLGIGNFASEITEVNLTLYKDATAFDINAKVNHEGSVYDFKSSVTEFGTHTNEDIENFVKNLPPYEPPTVPEGFTTAVAKLVNDAKTGIALVEVANWSTIEYVGNYTIFEDVFGLQSPYKHLVFNHEGTGYEYYDEGTGYELYKSREGGYTYDNFYTLFDIINDEFLTGAVFASETDTAYEGALNLNAFSYAGKAFSVLTGYGASYSASAVSFAMAKDGTGIVFTVTMGSYTEIVTVSQLGTFKDERIAGIIDGILNPQIDPSIPEGYLTAIKKIADDSAAHNGLLEVEGVGSVEYLGDLVMLRTNTVTGVSELDFNYEGKGYVYLNEGEGFAFAESVNYEFTYDNFYSLFDIINSNLPSAATFVEEDDDSYNGTLTISKLGRYAADAFADLAGLDVHDYSASAASFELAKDGTEITITATIGEDDYVFTVSNLGTFEDDDVLLLIEELINTPLEALTEWPEDLAEILGEDLLAQIPMFPNTVTVEAYRLSEGVELMLGLLPDADPEEAVEAYVELLAGFTPVENTHYYGGDYAYVAPSGEFELVPYYDDWYECVCIDIYFLEPEEAITEFPIDLIKEVTEYDGELPTLEGAFLYEVYDEEELDYGIITLLVYFETEAEATAAIETFLTSLQEDYGFTYGEELVYGEFPGCQNEDFFDVCYFGGEEGEDCYVVMLGFFYEL